MATIKPLEIKVVPCQHCDGIGSLPGPRTGKQLKRSREERGVSLNQLLNHFPYKKSYTFDLEAGNRPWNNRLVELYKQAIEAAVQERLNNESGT